MIRILTKKEYTFLMEFATLIEKYDVLFTMDKQERVHITIYEGNEDKPDITADSIHFKASFDENDIKELLDEMPELLTRLSSEYQTLRQFPS